jgi:Tfp pilus assembly protein PilF
LIDEAEVYYKTAVNLDSTHANNLCNYGLFLSEERKQYALAEEYYR